LQHQLKDDKCVTSFFTSAEHSVAKLMLLNWGYSEQITGKPFHEEQLLLDFHSILLLKYSRLLDCLVLTEVQVEYLSLPLEDLPNILKTSKSINQMFNM